jgi:hypothetical protein
MKLESLKSHRERDEKRGTMVTRKKEERFELDPEVEGEMIFELFTSRLINIVDEAYIPLRGEYKVIFPIHYETKEGFSRSTAHGEIELDQLAANKFLASGHVAPANEKAWRPADLIRDAVKTSTVKRMFDEEDSGPKPESWITRGFKRGGR